MKAKSLQSQSKFKKIISIFVIVLAVVIAGVTIYRYDTLPFTDNASIDAEVIHVAAEVGGRIVAIPVTENSAVKQGDVLFQIDPVPYQLVVDQAKANLALSEADLATKRRFLATQRSNVIIAGKQTKRAANDLGKASRTVNRLQPLQTQGYVPTQELDQAQTAKRDAETGLQQALEQEESAKESVDTLDAALAMVQARIAELAIALRNLKNTTVLSKHAGRVVGLTVSSGEMVAPSQAIFTLVNTEEWYAVANFRETDLDFIKTGVCATVYSMLDRQHAIKGAVQGIGFGVKDSDRINLPKSVPYIEKSLNWVRVAQRFPVRIVLKSPPPELMRMGASAVVEINHGNACR